MCWTPCLSFSPEWQVWDWHWSSSTTLLPLWEWSSSLELFTQTAASEPCNFMKNSMTFSYFVVVDISRFCHNLSDKRKYFFFCHFTDLCLCFFSTSTVADSYRQINVTHGNTTVLEEGYYYLNNFNNILRSFGNSLFSSIQFCLSDSHVFTYNVFWFLLSCSDSVWTDCC